MRRWEYLVAIGACLAACSFDTSNLLGPAVAPDSPDAADLSEPADASNLEAPVCDSDLAELVLCMQFEEGGGATTLLDESQYSNTATVSGAAFGAGIDGQALQGGPDFDSAIADSASLDVTTQITTELWINPDEDIATGRRGLFDNNGQYGFFIADGNRLRCSASGGPNLTSADAVVTRQQWQHVACVYDGASMRLYVDGTEVGVTVGSGQIGADSSDGSSVAQNSPNGDEFRGRMDTLRVWSVARTRAELCAGAGLSCP